MLELYKELLKKIVEETESEFGVVIWMNKSHIFKNDDNQSDDLVDNGLLRVFSRLLGDIDFKYQNQEVSDKNLYYSNILVKKFLFYKNPVEDVSFIIFNSKRDYQDSDLDLINNQKMSLMRYKQTDMLEQYHIYYDLCQLNPIPFIILDREKKIINYNKSLANLLRISLNQYLEYNYSDIENEIKSFNQYQVHQFVKDSYTYIILKNLSLDLANINQFIFDNIKEAIITIDSYGEIIYVNQLAVDLFGYQKDEFIGKNIKMIMTEPYYSKHDSYMAKYRKTRVRHFTDRARVVPAKKKDGTLFEIELSISEFDKKNFTAIIRKSLADNKKTINKTIDETQHRDLSEMFLANMSHEIRTPLNGIIGMSDMIKSSISEDDEINTYIDIVISCGNQLLSIVNDILDYSKMNYGNLSISHSEFNLLNTLEESVDNLILESDNKHNIITYKYDNQLSEYIKSDRKRVKQILLNLIGNSIKFTDKGFIEIEINKKGVVDNKRVKIEILVKDTGIGIEKSCQTKIFEAFKQIDNDYTRKSDGSGLGLAIVWHLSHLMGGTVSLESDVGKGSIFRVEIIVEELTETPYLKRVFTKEDLAFLATVSVLVIDDKIVNRISLNYMLGPYVKEVILASSYQEADSIINFRTFDVILMDICMPEVSGIDYAKILKDKKIKSNIIAISSAGDIIKDKKYFSHILTKPIKKDELLKTLMKELSPTYLANKTSEAIPESILKNNNKIPIYEINKRKTSSQKDINENGHTKLFSVVFRPKLEKKMLSEYKFLIAEDNPNNKVVLEMILNKLGFTNYKSVDNGQEAIDEVDKKKYDIILMDLKMPINDGFETSKYILERNPEQIIIVISASIIEQDKKRCLEMGIKDFITKPFLIETLKGIIDKYIAQ